MTDTAPRRAAVYARYSSDLQSQASIEDQTRICKALIESRGWQLAQIYSDMAISGATHLRPGFQQMQLDARTGRFWDHSHEDPLRHWTVRLLRLAPFLPQTKPVEPDGNGPRHSSPRPF